MNLLKTSLFVSCHWSKYSSFLKHQIQKIRVGFDLHYKSSDLEVVKHEELAVQ